MNNEIKNKYNEIAESIGNLLDSIGNGLNDTGGELSEDSSFTMAREALHASLREIVFYRGDSRAILRPAPVVSDSETSPAPRSGRSSPAL